MEEAKDGRRDSKEEESNKDGIQERGKDTRRGMIRGKGKERCKDHQKDPLERQFSTEIVMDAESKDTPKEVVHKWERDSEETATHVDA